MNSVQVLLSFAISIHQILAQNPTGFISLDCGLRESKGYDDSVIGLPYITDEGAMESGESRRISPEFKTNSLPRQFWNVRSFPHGSRNCYTLRPNLEGKGEGKGKGKSILLRAGFMYGNYDNQSKLPEFDLHLGVDKWDTITFESSSSVYYSEIIHVPKSEYLQVCLVNTGHGTPFISVLELRPVDLCYNTTLGSLQLLARWAYGSTASLVLRYKDGDAYDRIWSLVDLENTIPLHSSTPNSSFSHNHFNAPPQIMATAAQAPTTNDSIIVSTLAKNSSDQVYIYLHFGQILSNQSSPREMNIYINGDVIVSKYEPGVPVMSLKSGCSSYVVEINATLLPPFLNAAEFYTVKRFTNYATNDADVAAMMSIKRYYAITRNWQGDPCSPRRFAWIGITCTYNYILSLNLSASGLVGTIAPSISNLTMLQSLDLSYNNLTGEVPDFLSRLPSLRYLNLQGNEFSGSLPPALVLHQNSRNGSLILRNEEKTTKKKGTSIAIPIAAASVGFLTLIIVSITVSSYIIIGRRRKRGNGGTGPLIEPMVRQCRFSEVMSIIREKNVIGEGGFGIVYRGLMNGVPVAVKILKVSAELEITKDLRSEVKILARIHHKNLIRILGYCNEGTNRAIIFELLENGSLNKYLSESSPKVLSWELRLSIMAGAAQDKFEAKLADFGLSRIFPSQITRELGTLGYYNNEYSEPGMLTEKMDVYSFGVVLLVVVTGQPAIAEGTHITQRIAPKIRNGDIRGIVDPRLQGNYDNNVAWKVVELGMACVSEIRCRPNMHQVVRELNECVQTTTQGTLGVITNTTVSGPSIR
ncbi:hypothetical protein C2S53_014346 [Perilla frutescens var. hirtella]|uniref:non-specific serine/threonine protein kinase n=1 Tax=Perilla frutescens var. hirtella TaxID=608512 RepID=A0AAD4ISN4_PERFH|nr:hypothetical protein C2S53_014346 [Perilla frutescens var. hirtella]